MLSNILKAYGLEYNFCLIESLSSGLINNTWKVSNNNRIYILQKINTAIFKNPNAIAENIAAIGSYLYKHNPNYHFTKPINTTEGKAMLEDIEHGYFRLFPFIEGSQTFTTVTTANIAFEAAAQFGKFTNLLSGFDIEQLQITLPDFHNLSLRYNQFLDAVVNGNKNRKEKSIALIEYLISKNDIEKKYQQILQSPAFKKRVTHHDTKISNVLFDKQNKAICVIDLDTLMPGYFISDVGDMIRTYICPVNEEENDFTKIEIRAEYFEAIANGYLTKMKNELSAEEKKHFVYAGAFIIYMQALRFLTDYLNNDIYYGQKYEGHNLIRAGNQIMLLQKLLEKENELNMITQKQLN